MITIVLEYILMAVLFLAALAIIVCVTLQKSNEQGLSGTIAGGSETFFGKDKGMNKDKLLQKISLVAVIVFAVCVTVMYIIQPDIATSTNNIDYWQKLSEFSSIF